MIENVPFTVDEIQRTMPNCKELKMNLYDEDHVDYIMRVMPQLQFLNGIPVEREEQSSSVSQKEEEFEQYIEKNEQDSY